jgi:hypothetical protein
MINRTVLVDQIQEARKTLEKLLSLLQSAPVERDRFVSHLYQSRREYGLACERAGKGGNQIERCVISTFRVAESMGFKATIASRSTCCASASETRKAKRRPHAPRDGSRPATRPECPPRPESAVRVCQIHMADRATCPANFLRRFSPCL